ncbi:Small-conductance mechanosensitive channel [Dissulfuribacter thermophilus]|uniref:Small-conductance mechanosensitive channel n=1 Tax=Dissulfuribacter thermophilus TaxID=1156395 RepID=A0A1B9F965_9BACT|nr:mechanosensitive ion channel family protein [Dissulfuribacter thermophilus]OCC16457.1 Small-conductance mechanosensitive channel [Dissulfuribacter thermophilus]
MGKAEWLQYIISIPGLKALVIVVLYSIGAKIVDLILTKILNRLVKKTKYTYDDELLCFLHAPIIWTVFIIGCLHARLYIDLKEPWNEIILKSLQTILALVWWITSFKIATWAIQKSSEKIHRGEKFGQNIFFLLKNITKISLIALGIFFVLSLWKVNLTPLFASAGIAGIAVALAAKDTLANFFGGISIFADKSFKVGDYIILDSGERGEVVDIGIRSTKIKTRDDVMITIPNSILANAKITNESAPEPRFRLRVPVGVAYGSDLDQVEKLLLDLANSHPMVSKDPAPRVRIRKFSNSSIDLELLCWVRRPAEKGLALHDMLKSIYKLFNEKGIIIPFPQRDVHVYFKKGALK